MEPRTLAFVTRPPVIDRVIYATITLMSVLIIYDGWHHLRLIDVVAVIVGPVLAMFLAHIFSASLARQVELGRRLTAPERVSIARTESRFLLLCVPPVAATVLLDLAGVNLTSAIQIVLWMGVASLGLWCGMAGHRAGMTGWHLARSVLAGLALGLAVLALQVFLQPGKAISNGTALGIHASL